MSTRRQRAASRANAQKSTGPITTAGKAKSRFNALKHGIDAKQQVMFTESAEDLAELAAEFHELHSPADADERFLVDTMISCEWRIRRLRCVEADLWRAAHNLFLEKHAEIATADFGDAFTASGPAFDRLQRIVNSCERSFHRARKELQEAQAARAHDLRTPQPAQNKTTSESPASFRTQPETSPKSAAGAVLEPVIVPNPVQVPVEEQVPQPGEAMGASSIRI